MWILEWIGSREHSDKYYLLPNRNYTVGRKDCNILINESAVSRNHAMIVTTSPDEGPKIKDTSKFGTFVNGIKITEEQSLNDGDEVYFGHVSCKFRLKLLDLVVTTSCITDRKTKNQLLTSLEKLGGNIANEWSSACKFLVMERITFTIKVICALLNCCPIVTPTYFQRLVESLGTPKNSWLPHDSFRPEIAEPLLKDNEELFAHDKERKSLFQSKKFITFSKKQHRRLAQPMTLASALLEIHEDYTLESLDRMLNSNVIVLSPEENDEMTSSEKQRLFIEKTRLLLQRNGLRMVRESEVGLAIYFKSLDKYCNPQNAGNGRALPSSMAIPSMDCTQMTNATLTQDFPEASMSILEEEKVSEDVSSRRKRSIFAQESQASLPRERRRTSLQDKSLVAESIFVDYSENNGEGSTNYTGVEQVTLAQRAKEIPDDFLTRKSNPQLVHDRDGSYADVQQCPLARKGKVSSDSALILDSRPKLIHDTIENRHSDGDMEGTSLEDRKRKKTCDIVVTKRPKLEILEEDSVEQARSTFRGPCDDVNVPSPETRRNTLKIEEQEFRQPPKALHPLGVTDYIYTSGGTKQSAGAAITSDYLSTRGQPKVKVKLEDEVREHLLASAVKIQFVSLVVQKTSTAPRNPQNSNVKNFKKFQKSSYPGKERGIPRIIGGDDLLAYQKEDVSHNISFAKLREEHSRHEEEDRFLDKLFEFSDGKSLQRRVFR